MATKVELKELVEGLLCLKGLPNFRSDSSAQLSTAAPAIPARRIMNFARRGPIGMPVQPAAS